jgi:hypothetical protein
MGLWRTEESYEKLPVGVPEGTEEKEVQAGFIVNVTGLLRVCNGNVTG